MIITSTEDAFHSVTSHDNCQVLNAVSASSVCPVEAGQGQKSLPVIWCVNMCMFECMSLHVCLSLFVQWRVIGFEVYDVDSVQPSLEARNHRAETVSSLSVFLLVHTHSPFFPLNLRLSSSSSFPCSI